MASGLGSEQDFIAAHLRFQLTIGQASQNRLIVHMMHAIRTLPLRSLASSVRVVGSPSTRSRCTG
jgi:DNA-binding FadR family transcriptional regulator